MKKVLLSVMAFTLLAGSFTESAAYERYNRRRSDRVARVVENSDDCCMGPIGSLFSAVGGLVRVPFRIFNTCCDEQPTCCDEVSTSNCSTC